MLCSRRRLHAPFKEALTCSVQGDAYMLRSRKCLHALFKEVLTCSVQGGAYMLSVEVEFHHCVIGWAGCHGEHAPLLHGPGELIGGGYHSQFQLHFITAHWEWEPTAAVDGVATASHIKGHTSRSKGTHLSPSPNHFFSKSAELRPASFLSTKAGLLSSAGLGTTAEKSKSPWGGTAHLTKVKGHVSILQVSSA